MFANSKQTIIKILLLYLATSAIFLCIGFYYLISKEEKNIIFAKMDDLRDISFEIKTYLRSAKNVDDAIDEILKTIDTPFAIYDRNNNLIFSNLTMKLPQKSLRRGIYRDSNIIIANPNHIKRHHRQKMRHLLRPPLYNIFVESQNLDSEILAMYVKFGVAFLLIFTIMGIIAYTLIRIFLKPMNEYLRMLDTFIKDSTHEINTPLSVILMSIETISKDKIDEKMRKKLERIRLASLQLHKIYSDLVAYNFPQSLEGKMEKIALDSLLLERLDFFLPFFIQKNLEIIKDVSPASIQGNKDKFIILFDNLLSNAIKYNLKNGTIKLILKQGEFSIQDSGCGIKDENLTKIYERYLRFNKDSGGFGIGLNLVKQICDEYHIKIIVDSSHNGTKFTLKWEN